MSSQTHTLAHHVFTWARCPHTSVYGWISKGDSAGMFYAATEGAVVAHDALEHLGRPAQYPDDASAADLDEVCAFGRIAAGRTIGDYWGSFVDAGYGPTGYDERVGDQITEMIDAIGQDMPCEEYPHSVEMCSKTRSAFLRASEHLEDRSGTRAAEYMACITAAVAKCAGQYYLRMPMYQLARAYLRGVRSMNRMYSKYDVSPFKWTSAFHDIAYEVEEKVEEMRNHYVYEGNPEIAAELVVTLRCRDGGCNGSTVWGDVRIRTRYVRSGRTGPALEAY